MKSAMPNLDLNPHDWAEVTSILRRQVPELEVWAFGSRVRWTAKSHSDLDIALITPVPLSIGEMAEIKEAFDDSSLSIRVDIVDWSATSEKFKQIIESNKIVIQNSSTSTCAGTTWVPYRISEIGKVVTGKTPLTSNSGFQGIDVPFVTPPDFVGNKWIKETGRTISEAGAQSVKNNIIPAHAVLVTCIGSDMGKAAIAGKRCVTNQQINAIVVDERKFSPEFIFYNLFLRQVEIKQLAGRSAQPILNKSAFSEIWIDCPTLAEQQRVVDLMRPFDDRITVLRETNVTLEAIAQALFKSWFVDFDPVRQKLEGHEPEGMDVETAALFPDNFDETEQGLVPKGWVVRPLDEIADYLNGLDLQKFPPTDDSWLPVIKIAQLRKGDVVGADRAGCNIEPEYIIQNGDVLFSWSGSFEVEIWCGGEGALNQHLFKVTSSTYPKWFYYLWTKHHLESFRETAASKATTMGHIQRAHLSHAKVVAPPDEFVSVISGYFAPLLDRWISTALQIQNLVNLRDTLLPRVISGELRLPDTDKQDTDELAV